MTIYIGDCLTWLQKLPSESVHCIVTSPPYYGLRNYGVAGQIGLEETPEAYIEKMVMVFREARRVLRADGTLWLNLGDSYWHNRSENGDVWADGNLSKSYQARSGGKSHPVYKPKDLMFMPHRVAMALQADGWYIRSDIVWHKPNPMPESVTDRPTKSKEYVFLCSKSERYYYDAEAIRETGSENSHGGGQVGEHRKDTKLGRWQTGLMEAKVTGTRNKRDVWTINTEASGVAHFATMPTELAETCIRAGCPETVCAECGAGYVAIVDKQVHVKGGKRNSEGFKGLDVSNNRGNYPRATISTEIKGYAPSCTCNAATDSGIVLDPFGGAGTTAIAAVHLGRKYQLIELNIKYAGIAQQRIAAYNPFQATVLPDGSRQLSLFEGIA